MDAAAPAAGAFSQPVFETGQDRSDEPVQVTQVVAPPAAPVEVGETVFQAVEIPPAPPAQAIVIDKTAAEPPVTDGPLPSSPVTYAPVDAPAASAPLTYAPVDSPAAPAPTPLETPAAPVYEPVSPSPGAEAGLAGGVAAEQPQGVVSPDWSTPPTDAAAGGATVVSQPYREPQPQWTADSAAAPLPPPAVPAATVEAAHAEDEHYSDAGPNWMLAFVCLIAGATSLFEAWAIAAPAQFRTSVLAGHSFLGYALLGLGLMAFAAEALQWGRRRQGVGALLAVAVPALLTMAGVIYLILSHSPGRRI